MGILLASLVLVGTAQAHAVVVKSIPAIGEILAQAPPEIVLQFNEDLQTDYTRVELFNDKNDVVNPGPGSLDPDDHSVLRLRLDDLPDGNYHLTWWALSAVDGHQTSSTIPFGIGVAPESMDLIPPLGTADPALEVPSNAETAARWLNIAIAAVAFGAIPFELFALNQLLGQKEKKTKPQTRIIAWLRRLIVIGCTGLVFATLAFVAVQALSISGGDPDLSLGDTTLNLLSGYTGWILIIRMALAIAVGAIAWRQPVNHIDAKAWWIMLGLAAAAVVTFCLLGHGASMGSGALLAVPIDWLHVAATVCWLGGLVALAGTVFIVRKEPKAIALKALIPRFSTMAIICVVAIAVSGLYSFLVHVGNLAFLTSTSYGIGILVKTGLFGLLFAMGAVNLKILSPRLKKLGNRMARPFSITVRTEITLGALVLLAVGALTSVAPSQTAWIEHQSLWGNVQRMQAGDKGATLTLQVAPAKVGNNQFAVDVNDPRPGANAIEGNVLVRFTLSNSGLGMLQVDMDQQENGRFTAQGNYFSLPGNWNARVILRRSGFNDVTVDFKIPVGK